MNQKSKSIAELVDDRLKEIKFWPCPSEVRTTVIQKVHDKLGGVIKETLKDWNAVGVIARQADPNKQASTPTPQTAKQAAAR
jgi:hypothetical protein